MIKAKTDIPSFPTVKVKLSEFVILKGMFEEDISVQGRASLAAGLRGGV